MQEESREIMLSYGGCDFEADKAEFMQAVQTIEARHLPYFINRSSIFEGDEHKHLLYHFFFVFANGKVILTQAESSLLPPEIVTEVQALFKQMFEI